MKNNKYVVHIYNVCNVLMHEKMKPFILLLTLACIVSCEAIVVQMRFCRIWIPYISRILLKPLLL